MGPCPRQILTPRKLLLSTAAPVGRQSLYEADKVQHMPFSSSMLMEPVATVCVPSFLHKLSLSAWDVQSSWMAQHSETGVHCRYHQYKFIVDGDWRHDEAQPFMPDPLGNVNNWLFVRRPDGMSSP